MYKLEYKLPTNPPYTRSVISNGAHWASLMLWEEIWSKMIPMATNPGVSKLLDIGCALNRWTLNDFVVERADSNPKLGKNEISITNKFTLINCDRDEIWSIPNKAYEIVTAVELIEHLQNPWHFFREAVRISSSRIIITTPNTESKLSMELFKRTGYLSGFTPTEQSKASHITPIFKWQIMKMASDYHCRATEIKLSGIPLAQLPMMVSGFKRLGQEELLYDKSINEEIYKSIFVIDV